MDMKDGEKMSIFLKRKGEEDDPFLICMIDK